MSKISVIVPVYNAEKYLKQCIESILKQTFQDYDIILINDGSKDKSGIICNEYARRDKRITVIHTKNCGPAAARRAGVEAAQGKYITFVDADDWLDGNMLSFLIEELDKWHADIICLGHKEVDGKGSILSCTAQEMERIEMTLPVQMMYHLHGTRLIDSGPWAKLIARCLFEDIDFCDNVTIGEDYFMVLQLLEKAEKVVLCKEAMYNRCIRITSISRSGYTERHQNAFKQYMYWRRYLLGRYPELEAEIVGYHTEYEMAVMTAMCRNKKYDKSVIRYLVKDLRENWRVILHCRKTPLYMRVSAMVIAYCYPVFIVIFRAVHLLTGR